MLWKSQKRISLAEKLEKDSSESKWKEMSQHTVARSPVSVIWTKIVADIFGNAVSSNSLKVTICTLTPSTLFPGCIKPTSQVCRTQMFSCKMIFLQGLGQCDTYGSGAIHLPPNSKTLTEKKQLYVRILHSGFFFLALSLA